MIVGLISCGAVKAAHAKPARDLFTGAWFKLAAQLIERNSDEWGILSAMHGLVMPYEVIEPYNVGLRKSGRHSQTSNAGTVFLTNHEYRQWIGRTKIQLMRRWPFPVVHEWRIIMATDYAKCLEGWNVKRLLPDSLSLAQQIKYMRIQLQNERQQCLL